ncbi:MULTISPECIES: hypothetical protein [Chromobacterium]|uniref:hypothetical protein n=1 Tax=Chromobacterium TaxID=535 RepID=UPI001888A1E3|nr:MULTISPECIES: hypothetical protein [Chromobacterium]WON84479.1 hypothetical protein OK026_02875 [Chromobacterium haemolyticum]
MQSPFCTDSLLFTATGPIATPNFPWAGFFPRLEQVLMQNIAPLDVFECIDRLNTYELSLQQILRKTLPQT